MSIPKIKPCPRCQSDEHMNVYTYPSGWRHVECDKCDYLGPGYSSIKAAIKAHNATVTPDPTENMPADGGGQTMDEAAAKNFGLTIEDLDEDEE